MTDRQVAALARYAADMYWTPVDDAEAAQWVHIANECDAFLARGEQGDCDGQEAMGL